MKHLLLDTIVSHPDGLPYTSITNDEHYIGVLQLAGHDGQSLGFVFSQRKDTLESTLSTFQQSMLMVLILSGLLVLPIGVYFLNRTITRPIENLVICADDLRKGDPHNLKAFTGTDEFSKLAHAFQDMANLLSNACKFTPSGKHVDIRAERHTDAGTITISISDLGPGIPEAFEAQVFERFSQADQSLTRQDQRGGTGLGLAVTKSIIDMHDGHVTFSTVRAPKPAHGTTFTITLPEWNEDNDALPFTH